MREHDRDGAGLDEIEAIYRTRFSAFARTATAILGDAEVARDAVQEAFALPFHSSSGSSSMKFPSTKRRPC